MGQSHSSWGKGWPGGATVPLSTLKFDGRGGETTFGQFATELIPLALLCLAETERRGYIVGKGAQDDWAYNNRNIAGTNIPSNHSRGTALDINARDNAYGDHSTAFPPNIAHEVWEKFGWEWGGDWGTPDAMHFEYLPARSTVGKNTRKARRKFRD